MAEEYENAYPKRVDGAPDGPRTIGDRNQVTLPSDQLAQVGLRSRDPVWVAVNPDRPGTLVLMPQEVVEQIFLKGWHHTNPAAD